MNGSCWSALGLGADGAAAASGLRAAWVFFSAAFAFSSLLVSLRAALTVSVSSGFPPRRRMYASCLAVAGLGPLGLGFGRCGCGLAPFRLFS